MCCWGMYEQGGRTFDKVDGHLLELLVRQAPSPVLEV